MNNPSTTSWEDVRRRMDAVHAALEHDVTITPETKKAILKERALALAKERPKEQLAEAHLEIVEFVLASERYGIESSFIREIYPLRDLTPLPGTPPFVLGIINLRGEIISVIDIKKFFDLPEKGITDLNKVIVLRNAEMEFGVLADAVPGARWIAREAIQPPPATFTGLREEYLYGITVERIAILDAVKLLSDPKLIIQEETAITKGSQ